MIVVDLGCAPCAACDSVPLLVERFNPEVLYGFDPQVKNWHSPIDNTLVVLSSKVAWTHDGLIYFREDGVASCVVGPQFEPVLPESMWLTQFSIPRLVECFDLSAWLLALPDDEIVAKLDAEASEYTILPHLIETGAIDRISLLLMEWHGDERIEVPCPTEDWGH